MIYNVYGDRVIKAHLAPLGHLEQKVDQDQLETLDLQDPLETPVLQ